jgi:glutaredoxin
MLTRVFLPFLLLLYIGIETYLKLQNSSLCGQVGCKLAGELLNFDAIYLNYFGLVSVLFLMLLGYLSLKNKFFEALFFIGLYTGIAFEATILSYQFSVNPEPCIFCLGIFSSLLVIALFSDIKHFAITFATVLAIFIGMQTLAVTKNYSFITSSGYYLIQSKTCPHCIKVKAYLKENRINYTAISTKEASVRSFLKFVGISNIPVLVIKAKYNTRLITGDENIMAYFESKNAPKEAVSIGKSSYDRNLFSAVPDEIGCAITVIEEPNCETNSSE